MPNGRRSPAGLARRAGTSASYISELEAGRIVSPGGGKLFRIADVLGEEPGSPRNRAKKEPDAAGGIPEEETPGDRIRAVRMHRRLTQAQLARIAGIDHRHISFIETGRIRSPALDTVANLARALGVDPRELAAPDVHGEPGHRPGDMLMLDRCLRLGKRDRERIGRIIAECPAAADGAGA